MANISEYFAASLDEVRNSWGWFLLFGVLLVLLGILCVVKAQTATTFSIMALGWVLAISGVIWLINAFRALNWHGFFLFLLNGIIRAVAGYLLISHPDAGTAGITILLALLFIVGGLFRVSAAATIHFPHWGWTAFSGLVSLGLGIYLLMHWHATSGFLIGMMIGIDLIFDGGALIGFAGAIHSLPKLQVRKAA